MYEITLTFAFSQIAGLCSVLFAAVSNFQKQKNRILVLLILCNISCFIEYLFLGGLSGAYASILGIARAYIFYLYSKNNKDKNIFTLIVIVLTTIIVGILSYDGIISILPVLSAIVYTYGAWQNNLTIYRFCSAIGPLIWIFYDIGVSAYFGILTCVIEILGAIFAIIKIDILKNKNYNKI